MKFLARILVVAPGKGAHSPIAGHLRVGGYEVVESADGEAAASALAWSPVDAVLVDCEPPAMKDLDVLHHIRRVPAPAYLPVLAVVPDADTETAVTFLKHGASDYLVKPVVVAILHARLEHHLARRRAEQRTLQAHAQQLAEAERHAVALRRDNAMFREIGLHFHALTDGVQAGVVRTDAQGRCTYVNTRWIRMTGLTVAASTDDGWRKAFPGNHAQTVTHAMDALKSGEHAARRELQFVGSHGDTRWTEVHLEPQMNDRHAVCGFILTLVDITQARRDADELRASRQVLQSTLDALPHWISALDRNGRFLAVNSTMAHQVYGLAPEEMRGKDIVQNLVDSKSRVMRQGRHLTDLERIRLLALETGLPQELDAYCVPMADGQTSIRRAVLTPMLGPHGETTGTVSWSEDIASRLEATQGLRKTARVEAINQVTTGMANDFGNLLQVVSGYIQLAQNAAEKLDPLSPAYAGLIQNLTRAIETADQGGGLVGRLLRFAQGSDVNPARMDVNAQIEQSLALLQMAVQKIVAVEFRPDPGVPPAFCDRGMFEQMLLNLAINAHEAMPHGGQLRIETEYIKVGYAFRQQHIWAFSDAYVRIGVADTGVGMSDAVKCRIFEPFFTTKTDGRGRGLGLGVVDDIVSQHQGHIVVDSADGRGTTVHVYLPIRGPGASPNAEDNSDADPCAGMPSSATEPGIVLPGSTRH